MYTSLKYNKECIILYIVHYPHLHSYGILSTHTHTHTQTHIHKYTQHVPLTSHTLQKSHTLITHTLHTHKFSTHTLPSPHTSRETDSRSDKVFTVTEHHLPLHTHTIQREPGHTHFKIQAATNHIIHSEGCGVRG